jgi:hypothetical protein
VVLSRFAANIPQLPAGRGKITLFSMEHNAPACGFVASVSHAPTLTLGADVTYALLPALHIVAVVVAGFYLLIPESSTILFKLAY